MRLTVLAQQCKAAVVLVLIVLVHTAVHAQSVDDRSAKPVRLILVGDSTMAPNNGYGNALCERLKPPMACINLAKNGRSSGSFRAEGLWREVQSLLSDKSAPLTYVLIQFGHNDQPGKPGRSTDLLTEFPNNLTGYIQDVRALGAIPVLITPLSRRSFRDGIVQSDLRPWAETALTIAATHGSSALDLNAESALAIQRMGSEAANTLAVEPPPDKATTVDTVKAEHTGAKKSAFDYTHLGPKGAAYFARMVQRELTLAIPTLGSAFIPETNREQN